MRAFLSVHAERLMMLTSDKSITKVLKHFLRIIIIVLIFSAAKLRQSFHSDKKVGGNQLSTHFYFIINQLLLVFPPLFHPLKMEKS